MAATSETFNIDAQISPFQTKPSRDQYAYGARELERDIREPVSRIYVPISENTIVVGATDSVTITFTTTLPEDGIYKLKSLNLTAISATTVIPAITVARYSQPIATIPGQPQTFRCEWKMNQDNLTVGTSAALRVFALGMIDDYVISPYSNPPYFQVSDGVNPSILLFDPTGGVEALAWTGLMVFDYWTTQQFSYGLPLPIS